MSVLSPTIASDIATLAYQARLKRKSISLQKTQRPTLSLILAT